MRTAGHPRQHASRPVAGVDGNVETLFLEIALGQRQEKEGRRALEQPVQADADPGWGLLRPGRGHHDSQQQSRYQCFRLALHQHGYPFFRM